MLNWIQIGGPIMWMLIALSVGAALIFFERVVQLHRAQIKTGDFLRGIGNVLGRSGPPPPAAVVEAVSICDQTEGPVARMVRAAVLELGGGVPRVREVMEQAGLAELPKLERNLALLLTLAQCAPIAGLLGTVLGLIHVFFTIMEKAPLVHAGDLGGGLSQALITTAAGLAIALPTYVGYNFLVSRVDGIVLDMERSCIEFQALVRQWAVVQEGPS
jgi:biopolymer transport protein ExbB